MPKINRIGSTSITYASKRFSCYLVGMSFQVETDHKLLVSLLVVENLGEYYLFKSSNIDEIYLYILHTPGRDLTIAHKLSCMVKETLQCVDESSLKQFTDLMILPL